MEDTIIHQRIVETFSNPTTKRGRLVITAKLHQLGDQDPYFSVTTGSGCDHASILKARPDLEFMCDLHLSNQEGVPMHSVANAVYYLQNNELEVARRHLRMDDTAEFEALTGKMLYEGSKAKGEASTKASQLMLATTRKLQEARKVLSQEPGQSVNLIWCEEHGKAAVEPAVKGLDHLYALLEMIGEQDKVERFTEQILGKLVESRRHPGKFERRTGIMYGEGPLKPYFILLKRNSFAGVEDAYDKIRKFREVVEGAQRLCNEFSVERLESATEQQAKNKVLQQFIDDNLKARWKAEADEAITWLKEKDYDNDLCLVGEACELDPQEKQLVRLDGSITEIDSLYSGGYLPNVDLGGEDYYIAADSKAAGEAAREYYQDMAEQDPEEFTCFVGEQTLLKWALGQPAGVGTVTVTSLNEWLDLHLKVPHETWATYDGQEQQLFISAALAEELGIDNSDGNDWVEVVAYRHN